MMEYVDKKNDGRFSKLTLIFRRKRTNRISERIHIHIYSLIEFYYYKQKEKR